MSRENTQVNPVTVIIIIVSIMLIGGLVRNAISLRQDRQRLVITKSQVDALEAKKIETEKLATAQTDEAALDQAIRNKLNLAKPGETLIVIAGTESASLSQNQTTTPNQVKAPIHQWWDFLNPPNN